MLNGFLFTLEAFINTYGYLMRLKLSSDILILNLHYFLPYFRINIQTTTKAITKAVSPQTTQNIEAASGATTAIL